MSKLSRKALNHPGGLVVVQNRETQFDAPLYALIHRNGYFPLSVVYTSPAEPGGNPDEELGFKPKWDHISAQSYKKSYLSSNGVVSIWRLARQLRSQQPELVVIFGYYPRCQLLLALFLRLLGQRIGLRTDNTLQHTVLSGFRGRIRAMVVGRIQRLFHSWHPVGSQALDYLHTLSGSHKPHYRFSYSVDNTWFFKESSVWSSQRSAFLSLQGWPSNAFVVLGIMKWTHREDPNTLIQAFALLQKWYPRARMLLIGDGPLRDDVNAAIKPLGSIVYCPGYQPYSALPRWYAMADVFVHPSPDEPWGVSVNEAMACGVPVVATQGVGAGHELIEQGVNGFMVPNYNPRKMAEKLLVLAQDHNLRNAMRAACLHQIDGWHYKHSIAELQHALADATCSPS